MDRAFSGQILWPGPPEKPRVAYLWTLSQLETTTEGRRGFSDFITGEVRDDVTDPRTSNTLMRPYGVFSDGKEKLYIADPGAFRVSVVDLNTMEVLQVTETKEEELLSPVGVVADAAGRIYVSDSVLRKVLVFDQKGTFLSEFEGEFKRPTCLAFDGKNSVVYVSDTLDHRVYRYSAKGTREAAIGGPGSREGEFNFPTHLFVDGEGFLYVTDSMNFRIQIFRPDGTFDAAIGGLGDSHSDLEKPKGVAADSSGNIYVVDSIHDTVKIFNRQGELLLFFGEKGNRPGEFWLPSGIFVDGRNIIYVADTYNMRVQAFQFLKEQEKK